MLEQMRKQGASIFVYLIFCLLIAIFVINFRPGQSRNDSNGCSGTSNVVLSVDGTDSTQTAYKIAYSSPYNYGTQKGKVYIALETLIRRELLADAAIDRGLMVTEDLVMDEIRKGRFYALTPVPNASPDVQESYANPRKHIPGIFFETGEWNLKAFKGWVGQLNVSQNAYIEEQRRSLLAAMMTSILTESVQVSRDEALHRFMTESNTVTYDVVAFKPDTYRAAMRFTDADVDRFLATHADEVSARYKADERTYKTVKPQLKLRQIFIAKLDKPAEAPKKADDKKPDDQKPDAPKKEAKADDKKDDKKDAKKDAKKDVAPEVKPVGMPLDEAKAKLETVRTAAAANKQKFIDAAKELSSDEAAKAVAGDLGWHSVDNAMLGDKAINEAVKALKPGELTAVISTDRGVYLIMAEDKREGDLSFDQVKKELALELAKDVWGKEAAKRAAIAALDGARNGVGMNLEQLYEKDAAPSTNPGIDIEQLMNDPNIPDEQKQKIREMIQNQKHGALERVEKDIPAGWFEDDAAAPATAGSAAAAAGSGAATPPPPPPVPPVVTLAPSKDQLPATSPVAKAHVNRFGPTSRAKQMAGLGQSKEAVAAVFEDLQPGNLAKQIYEADGAYIVVQLIARSQANIADFDKDADRRVAELRRARSQEFLEEWLKTKCEALAKDGKIKPQQELLIEHDDQGKVLPIGYKPCMTFR